MSRRSLISRNPKVMSGAYCIRGTRITVHVIQNWFKGWSARRIAKEYGNRFSIKSVQAALDFRRVRKP